MSCHVADCPNLDRFTSKSEDPFSHQKSMKPKFHDVQKFLYVWDINRSSSGHQQQPIQQEAHCSAAQAWNRFNRVALYHRQSMAEKLYLFRKSVFLARKLYKNWKKRLRSLDEDRLFTGDMFAWGVLPMRALHHPNSWVPLPAGKQIQVAATH